MKKVRISVAEGLWTKYWLRYICLTPDEWIAGGPGLRLPAVVAPIATPPEDYATH